MQSVALNPYSPGGAITDPSGSGFFGREEIFQFVRSAIEARRRTPIIIYGQRRIGKSSILRQIPYRLSAGICCVYYDLQGKAGLDLDQVLFGLAREISRELDIAKPQREEATEATFATEFLPRALHALDDQPARLVLLFDEFDVLDERIAGEFVAGRKFIDYLATLQTQQPAIGYIIVVGRKTDELSREFNSALLSGSVQERIGRLDRQHSDELVCKLAQTQDVLWFSKDALDRIYSLTAGHPYCTQLLCFTIWARTVEAAMTNIEVTVPMVEDAVVPSLEYGTLGLNWIFDGLAEPAYKLFLSALAETGDPFNDTPASFSAIERVLGKRQVTLDQVEFSQAPDDLKRWDIIDRRGDGFHFQVPLIGIWIRKERPLQVLENEVRYSNPRAYAYFELAKAAHQAGDLERAISDYKGALKENPVFFEAQRDLAIALSKSDKPEDIVASIESYERALDLDEEMPKTGFIQVLINALDVVVSTEQLIIYFDRVKQLDIDGGMKLRAERQLRNRALQMLSAEQFRDAEMLFRVLADKELTEIARGRRNVATTLRVITVVVGVAAIVFRVTLAADFSNVTKTLLLALIGACFGESLWSSFNLLNPLLNLRNSPLVIKKSKQFLLKRTVLPTLIRVMLGINVGFGFGWIVSRFSDGSSAQTSACAGAFYFQFILPTITRTRIKSF